MDELRVVARYAPTAEFWVDMPEAKPRSRCRAKTPEPQAIEVYEDGSIIYDDALVEIDDYQDEKYADLRAEKRESA